jgi:hypothetical protein
MNPCVWKHAIFFPGEHHGFVFDIYGSAILMPENALLNNITLSSLLADKFYNLKANIFDLKSKLARLNRHVSL